MGFWEADSSELRGLQRSVQLYQSDISTRRVFPEVAGVHKDAPHSRQGCGGLQKGECQSSDLHTVEAGILRPTEAVGSCEHPPWVDEGAPTYVALSSYPQADLPRPLSFLSILATHDLPSISGTATHCRRTFSESQSHLGPTISNISFHPLPWTLPWDS